MDEDNPLTPIMKFTNWLFTPPKMDVQYAREGNREMLRIRTANFDTVADNHGIKVIPRKKQELIEYGK